MLTGGWPEAGGAAVRIGTSGWSYPGGRGSWNGVFYPARREGAGARRGRGGGAGLAPAGGRFDELAYYAERFDTVEVNSTFYRIPPPETTRGWARRTPANFEFAVKLHQKFTHPALAAASLGDEAAVIRQDDIDAFRRAIEPLAAAGKLGPLLAQFPPSFTATAESRDYLGWLLETFREHRLAVELRHRSWSDARKETSALLAAHDAAWVQIDEPKFRFSIAQDFHPNIAAFLYARLHGRNRAAWWDHDAAEDRYDYLYSAAELEPIAEAARRASLLVRTLYLYMNNHFEAKAVANAVMLKARLGLPVPGTWPESFVRRFPEVRGLVATATSPLLP
jgi:uncharacterized protein YecE (DUF72 family)